MDKIPVAGDGVCGRIGGGPPSSFSSGSGRGRLGLRFGLGLRFRQWVLEEGVWLKVILPDVLFGEKEGH
jgi:hypothetical protein